MLNSRVPIVEKAASVVMDALGDVVLKVRDQSYLYFAVVVDWRMIKPRQRMRTQSREFWLGGILAQRTRLAVAVVEYGRR